MRLSFPRPAVRFGGAFILGNLAGAVIGCLTKVMPLNSPATWLFLGCAGFTVLVLTLVAILVWGSVLDYRKKKHLWPFVPVTIARPETTVAAPQHPGPRKEPPRPKDKPHVEVIEGSLSPIGFYLDQDISSGALLHMQRKQKLNVISTYEAGRGGSSDHDQLLFAARNRRRIITCDKGFRGLHKQGIPHAGIIIAPRGAQWYPEILRVCLMLAEAAKA